MLFLFSCLSAEIWYLDCLVYLAERSHSRSELAGDTSNMRVFLYAAVFLSATMSECAAFSFPSAGVISSRRSQTSSSIRMVSSSSDRRSMLQVASAAFLGLSPIAAGRMRWGHAFSFAINFDAYQKPPTFVHSSSLGVHARGTLMLDVLVRIL